MVEKIYGLNSTRSALLIAIPTSEHEQTAFFFIGHSSCQMNSPTSIVPTGASENEETRVI